MQIWLKPSGWDALDDCRRHVAAARTERARLGAPSSPGGGSGGGGGGSEGGEERDASELEAVARRCVRPLLLADICIHRDTSFHLRHFVVRKRFKHKRC